MGENLTQDELHALDTDDIRTRMAGLKKVIENCEEQHSTYAQELIRRNLSIDKN